MDRIHAPPPSDRLAIRGLTKHYGATRALDDVDLVCGRGEIVSLMGANGAGKSTLVKILCGLVQADAGRITLDGAAIAPQSPAEAQAFGIVAVHQSIADVGVPTLSVADNLLLDRFATGAGSFFVGHRSIRRAASAIAAAIGLDVDLAARLDMVSLADRQLIAIARAVARKPSVMLFDEPTASLSSPEAERLFAVIERSARQRRGHSLHFPQDGRSAPPRRPHRWCCGTGAWPAPSPSRWTFKAALTTMIGRDVDHRVEKSGGDHWSGAVVLRISEARLRRSEHRFRSSVFTGRRSRLSVTGPVGSGKTALGGCDLRPMVGSQSRTPCELDGHDLAS